MPAGDIVPPWDRTTRRRRNVREIVFAGPTADADEEGGASRRQAAANKSHASDAPWSSVADDDGEVSLDSNGEPKRRRRRKKTKQLKPKEAGSRMELSLALVLCQTVTVTVIIALVFAYSQPTSPWLPMVKRVPLAELKTYAGAHESGRTYVSLKGTIFNVSPDKDFALDGKYAAYRGHEVARAVAKASFDPADFTDNLEDLTLEELNRLERMDDHYRSLYYIAGYLAVEDMHLGTSHPGANVK